MATLKDHQQAMVDLLASGSGIPASASRLAHAMHDVLAYLNLEEAIHHAPLYGVDATTPGLNDKALAGDLEACRPKDTMFDRARAAERRVKELENTVNQLRASNAKLKSDIAELKQEVANKDELLHDSADKLAVVYKQNTREDYFHYDYPGVKNPEQAGCRRDDTQVCNHSGSATYYGNVLSCDKCGEDISE